MLLHDLLHVPVRIPQGDGDSALAVAAVQQACDGEHGLLPLLQAVSVVIPEDVVQLRQLLVAVHAGQVIEALVALCVLRTLPGRQQPGEFHGDQGGVLHLVFGGAGMDADALHRDLARGGVEAFVFQLAHGAAVHRVGEVRAEARHVEQIRPAADFLVRGEGHADFAVVRRVRRQHPFAQRHDFRHAGLVVRAEDGIAGGDDQLLARQGRQEIKPVDDDAVLQRDGLAVVAGDDLRPGGAFYGVGGVHVGDQADGRAVPGALCRNGAVDVAVLIHPGIRHAHVLQLLRQQFRQGPLAGRGGAAEVLLAGGGFNLYVAQEALFDIAHDASSFRRFFSESVYFTTEPALRYRAEGQKKRGKRPPRIGAARFKEDIPSYLMGSAVWFSMWVEFPASQATARSSMTS